jgi:toxin ParE1/3/4
VGALHFSRLAEADLLEIGAYTLRRWGEAQAVRYLGELEACCQRLSDNPTTGRPCDHVRQGLRRLEHGKHVVFYRAQHGGIQVSRILHQRMLPERHAIDDEEAPTIATLH